MSECPLDVLTPFSCPCNSDTHFRKKCQQMCLGQFVLIPRVSVYKDTPPVLIGAKTEIPCPSAQFNLNLVFVTKIIPKIPILRLETWVHSDIGDRVTGCAVGMSCIVDLDH